MSQAWKPGIQLAQFLPWGLIIGPTDFPLGLLPACSEEPPACGPLGDKPHQNLNIVTTHNY